MAAVALFYPLLDFGLLTELGEEIDNSGRTIPIALFGGVAVVALFYVGLLTVLVGIVPWAELGSPIDIAVAAERFLPPWGRSRRHRRDLRRRNEHQHVIAGRLADNHARRPRRHPTRIVLTGALVGYAYYRYSAGSMPTECTRR